MAGRPLGDGEGTQAPAEELLTLEPAADAPFPKLYHVENADGPQVWYRDDLYELLGRVVENHPKEPDKVLVKEVYRKIT